MKKNNVRFYIFLALISLAALALRLLVSADIFAFSELSHSPPPHTDMFTYLELSRQIHDGSFKQAFYFQPFYYAVFLPALYAVGVPGIWGIVVAQCILGALTAWFTGIAAAMLRGRRCGVIAALLVSFSAMPVLYCSFALIATLKAFLIALLAFSVFLAVRRNHPMLWAAAGLLCSALVLTRANTLIFLPLVLLLAFLTSRNQSLSPPLAPASAFLSRLSGPLIVLAVFIIPQIPFSIHNTRVEGRLSPPSTSGAANLAIGNNPEACPAGLSYSQTSTYWSEHSKDISVVSRIISWTVSEPLAVAELTFRKLLVFWDAGEVFDNVYNYDIIRENTLLSAIPLLPTSLLLACCLSSLFFIWRKILGNRRFAFVAGTLVMYWLAIAAFIHLSRYRIAILPILAMLSAYIIDKIVQKSSSPRKSIPCAAALVLSAIFVFSAYPFYRHHIEKYVYKAIQPKGVRVSLGTDKLYIDNSPRLSGSWQAFQFLPSNTIEKTFAISPADSGKPCEFHIDMFCPAMKPFEIRLNGMSFTSVPDNVHMVFKFKTTVPNDGRFVIEPLTPSPGDAFAYLDLQRDFKRTSFNGSTIRAELVSRLVVHSIE